MIFLRFILLLTATRAVLGFVQLLDGGKELPKLYDGWMNDQIGKQASSAVERAIRAGKTKIEVNFPPVPNVEEVRFGTPLNQRFGTKCVGPDLDIKGGYRPGSNLSRQLIAYANIYWAKRLARSVKGGLLGGNAVTVLTGEPVALKEILNRGDMAQMAQLGRQAELSSKTPALILVNPGGEETWERVRLSNGTPKTCVVLNSAYSTTYNLGNKAGYEEAYYLKRISKGWVFRMFPGPWQAFMERPDGMVELLQSYEKKPQLSEVATLVREESFRRFAVGNDRWMSGRL
ncbi:hypothetical protein MPSEU_000492200 [Mayamaea pseudoterrestris]|nr:hypothetical protein MPSEU_000492200 [Mayamaea pseudoterrestris]